MTEEEPPNDVYLLHSVYVKMEIDENGVVEGIDDNIHHYDKIEAENYYDSNGKQKKSPRIRKKPDQFLFCDHCDYKTVYKRCLKFHMMNHTNTVISCSFCSYTTKYPASLERHTISLHKDTSNLPTFQCPECPYKSIFKSNLTGHMRKHAKIKRYICDKCEYATSYSILLIKHKKARHEEKCEHVRERKTYQCHLCAFLTKSDGILVRHLVAKHNEVPEKAAKCDNCNFMTKTRWRLTIHKKRSYQEKELNCYPCRFITNYACEYRKHKREHLLHDKVHRNENMSGNPGEVTMVHIGQQIHTNDQIEVNTDMFSQPNAAIHEESSINLFKTERIQFPNLSNMYPPKAELPPDFINQCLDKKLPEDYIDWRDIPVNEISSPDRTFLCTVCVYSSKFKAAVQRHHQRHHMSNTKPYKCPYCDFSTKTKDQLSLHVKRSRLQTLQYCQNCPYTSYIKCQLAIHQKSHDQFRCDLCDFSCRQKFYFQRHYMTVHQKNPDDILKEECPDQQTLESLSS